MENKIFCSRCGCENSSEYKFCVGCGAELIKPAERPAEPCSANAGSSFSEEQGEQFAKIEAASFEPEVIGNMPIAAAEDFVGKNIDAYIPKFIKFHKTGSNSSWNWAAALWTFFGMPFVWFFYRKMYKIGAILLAVCLVISVVSLLSALPVIQAITEAIPPYLEQIMSDPSAELPEEVIMEILSGKELVPLIATADTVSNIVSFIELCIFVFVSIGANKLYMNHMLKVFNKAAEKSPEGVTSSELKRLGGTSTGAAVCSGVGFFIATSLFELIPLGEIMSDYIKTVIEVALNSTL